MIFIFLSSFFLTSFIFLLFTDTEDKQNGVLAVGSLCEKAHYDSQQRKHILPKFRLFNANIPNKCENIQGGKNAQNKSMELRMSMMVVYLYEGQAMLVS